MYRNKREKTEKTKPHSFPSFQCLLLIFVLYIKFSKYQQQQQLRENEPSTNFPFSIRTLHYNSMAFSLSFQLSHCVMREVTFSRRPTRLSTFVTKSGHFV